MLDERFDRAYHLEPVEGRFDRAYHPEQFDSDLKTEGFPAEGRLERQEIEAGALLILACAVGWSFARMWKPGMNDIPHSGCLPLEEYLLERSLPLEADETLSVNGRSWLTLK